MSKIRSKNTTPELKVRKALTGIGLRYRLHSNKYPGKPDIVIPSRKTALFVNGCFWHRHKGCKRCTTPRSGFAYWGPKLMYNVERQKKQIQEIEMMGLKTLIVWECETKNQELLTDKLKGVFL